MNASDGFLGWLEAAFKGWIVAPIDAVVFFDVAFWDNGSPGEIELPIVVLWLVLGALFFTLRFQFINFRGFLHAIDCVRGRYSQPGEAGDISHFQALSAALSATVGLGNIAGVAFAVGVGGRQVAVDNPWFTVRLAPGSGARMVVQSKRYANDPTLVFPMDRR